MARTLRTRTGKTAHVEVIDGRATVTMAWDGNGNAIQPHEFSPAEQRELDALNDDTRFQEAHERARSVATDPNFELTRDDIVRSFSPEALAIIDSDPEAFLRAYGEASEPYTEYDLQERREWRHERLKELREKLPAANSTDYGAMAELLDLENEEAADPDA